METKESPKIPYSNSTLVEDLCGEAYDMAERMRTAGALDGEGADYILWLIDQLEEEWLDIIEIEQKRRVK